jgi:hypothetical protein
LLAALLPGLAGCVHPQTRAKAEDEMVRDKPPEIETVGDITSLAEMTMNPQQVSGVGLVEGLDGTGGGAPPGMFRKRLEHDLAAQRVPDVQGLLSSRNTAMVLVSAMVPTGSHRDDPVDIDVSLPPGSHTTSLRGGRLRPCFLYDFNTTGQGLRPDFDLGFGPNQLLWGHARVRAAGPLVVGLGEGDATTGLRQGRIWGGGRCTGPRVIGLLLNEDRWSGPVAQRVADRINETFHSDTVGGEIAHAQTKQVVLLSVPPQYHLNLPHYLRVVALIPLSSSHEVQVSYRRRLADQLLDPAHAVGAALRLEALGVESIDTLKHGLQSDHPLVRFCAAQALAYLDCAACGQALGDLAAGQPELRAYVLTALASLDESVSHVVLTELLNSADPQTRYGAFWALRALDEHDPAVEGELLNDAFWLHHVAPSAPPLVHLSASRRPEIVLFGDGAELNSRYPISIVAGEFTVTAGQADPECTVSRFSVQQGASRERCSLKVEDVLHALARLGATYTDAVEVLRQAGDCQCLSCRVAVDQLPQVTSVADLEKKRDDFLKQDKEVHEARSELGAAPTLFEGSHGRLAAAGPADEAVEWPDSRTAGQPSAASRR